MKQLSHDCMQKIYSQIVILPNIFSYDTFSGNHQSLSYFCSRKIFLKITKVIKILSILVGITMNSQLFSDEGMWTLDNLPLEMIKTKYKFTPKKSFLNNIQLSAVRFNDGGSGAFVSQEGLVLTNHHVAMGQLQKISKKTNDYVKNGFLALNKSQELKCPDLELNILIGMENVTEIVKSFTETSKNPEEMEAKRKEITSKIENDSYSKTGLRSDVVELYNGGEFWLYKYKRYTDIRLVHSPELQAASFGGDTDNFQYPRYALDYAFFRVYEDNKPIQSKNYLRWNPDGPDQGEILFVAGHPGSTDRQKTVSELIFLRDHSFPEYLKILGEKISAMREYAARGKEEKRRAMGSILGMENAIKAIHGEFDSLKDPGVIDKIRERESELKKLVSQDKILQEKYGDIWDNISAVQGKMVEKKKEMYYQKFSGHLPSLALSFIEYYLELKKPNEERYEEYRDSSLESMRLRMLTSAPVYKDKDIVTFTKSLELSQRELGLENEYIQLALGKRNARELSENLISKTSLDSLEFRKSLLKDPEQIMNSNDPLLNWVRNLEPLIRKNRRWVEKEVENILTTEGGRLAELRFKIFGRTTYPDATFTLRVSVGTVKPYQIDGWSVPAYTTFHGLYERALGFGEKNDYSISEQITKNKEKINSSSKINFCSTHDITGGNSGSPVINKKGEIVGLIFDGNAYSHSLSYTYSDEKARAISVHIGGIEELLAKVYKANHLIKELKTK